MNETEEVLIEEETPEGSEAETKEGITTEELKVKGEELVEAVKGLLHEAGIRRIVIKYKDGRTLIEIPIVLGVAGIMLLPTWTALALAAALVTECTILVERVEKAPEEETTEEVGKTKGEL